MDIHCIVTFTILLLVMVQAHAQPIWDTVYHHHYDKYDQWPIIEIRQPKIVDRFFDDDLTQSIRRLNLFESLNHPPVIYLPRIQFVPDFYVEERFPHTYNGFEEPMTHPYRSRLLTTLSVSYKAKVLPVVDYKDESEETVQSSSSENAPQEVKNSVATKSTTKKDKKVGTKNANPSQGVVKIVTPKPNKKAEPVTKPEAEPKPGSDQTTQPSTNTEPATDDVNNVDAENESVEEVVNSPTVGNADAANVVTTPENIVDGTKEQSVPKNTAKVGDATTGDDVPTP